MIQAYAKNGLAEEELNLYYQMQRIGSRPNNFLLSSIISACARLGILQHGKAVHEEINKNGFQHNVFVSSVLIDMYVKCRTIDDARQVFEKMPERNAVLWTAIIAGYAQKG